MSYTPHTWVNDETITAAKLNNIEEGVQEAAQSGGGGLTFITWTYNSGTTSIVLDMTIQQISDGMLAGNVYAVYFPDSIVGGWSITNGMYMVVSIIDETGWGNGVSVNCGDWYFGGSTYSDYPSKYIGD